MANANSGTAQGSAEAPAPGTTQLAQAHGEPIGQISSATGPVHVTHADGTGEDLGVGGQIYADDVIQTAPDGEVAITFVDGTQFSLGGNAEMKIDKLIYDPSGSDNALALSVVQGAFVFVTGGIAGAPGEGMTVGTPAGSIGVRGTSVGGHGGEGPEGWVVALLKDESGHVGKVVVYNSKGEVVLDEQFESTTLIDFNSPPSSPVILSKEQIHLLFGQPLEQLPDLLLQNEERRTELEFETAAGPGGHGGPNHGSHFFTPTGFNAGDFDLQDLTLPPSLLDGTNLDYSSFFNNGHNPNDKQFGGGPPLFGLALGGGELPENSPAGTVAGFVAAIIGGPPNAIYTYSLIDQQGQQTLQLFSVPGFAPFAEPQPAFEIDPNTGVITVHNPDLLDYETTHGFHLTIHAQNNFGQSVDVPFDIALEDVNDNPPVIDPLGPVDLAENSAAGTVVATVTATDADSTGGPTQYSIVPSSDPDGLFAIDPATGVITLTAAGAASPLLDFESGIHSITLQIAATDGTNDGAPIDVEIDITDVPEPVWSISGASTVTEGNVAAYFVSYTGAVLAPGQTLTIDVAPGSGTAIVGSDVVGGTTTLTFTGGGETSQSIAVTTIDDTVIEGTENFSVSIANPNAGTIATPTQATSLVDNAEPLVWNITGDSAGEEGSIATYTVSYSGATLADGVTVTVTVSSQSGSATQDQDFGGVDQVLTFTGGSETFQTVTVPLLSDSTVEDPENFTVSLASDTGDAGEATTTTVIDDPSQPIAWSVAGSGTVEEGQDAVYTVSYTGGPIAPGAAATVTIASAAGSALEGEDFSGLTTVLTFSGGEPASQTIAISVNADTVIEGTEDYSVSITGVGGGSIDSGSVTTAIIDKTSGPVWSIGGYSTVAEGSDATYTVSYSGTALAPGQTAFVTLDTASGTADEDSDFAGRHIVLTFTGGGATAQTLTVHADTDTLIEGTEDFSVSISPSIGGTGPGSATTGIIDETTGPVWSIGGDSTVAEGSNAAYTVSYSGSALAPGQTVFVTVDTASGSADEDSDFDGRHIVLTFTGGGATAQTLTVHADTDTVIEGDETYSVSIATSQGTLAGDTIYTTIGDETTGPTWTLSGDSAVTEGSDAAYTVSYSDASLAPGQTAFVTVDTGSGSADEGSDFDGRHIVLTFTGGGDSFQSFTVHTIQDTVAEDAEDYTVSISPSQGQTVTGSVTTSIIDDDDADRLLVGTNSENTGPGTAETSSTSPYADLILEGGRGPDVLIGDSGGATQEPDSLLYEDQNAIAVLDRSGSVADSDNIQLAKNIVLTLAQKYATYAHDAFVAGQEVTVKFTVIPFNGSAGTPITVTANDLGDLVQVSPGVWQFATLAAAVNAISASGNTDFQDALAAARSQFLADSGLPDSANYAPLSGYDGNNTLFFISDGHPTEQTSTFQGYDAPSGSNGLDYWRGVWTALGIDAHAIGIGLTAGSSDFSNLQRIDNTGGAEIVTDPNQVGFALEGQFHPGDLVLDPVGGDSLSGGNGGDIIFGDVINTDGLESSTVPGEGYDALLAQIELDLGHAPSDQEVLVYIRNHLDSLYLDNDPRGSADRIDGGAGDDTVFAQGGDDTVAGGLGADLLDGGTGNDRIVADALAGDGDGSVDTLIGGMGSDILVGSSDEPDYFQWKAGHRGAEGTSGLHAESGTTLSEAPGQIVVTTTLNDPHNIHYFTFEVTGTESQALTIDLKSLSGNLDTQIYLFRDTDGNGLLSGNGFDPLISSNNDDTGRYGIASDGGSNGNDSFIVQGQLAPGKYILAIGDSVLTETEARSNDSADGNSNDGSGSGQYQLTITGDHVELTGGHGLAQGFTPDPNDDWDTVQGFTIGGGDMLDFSDLLSGAPHTGSGATAANLSSYFEVSFSGGNTILSVDYNGAAGPSGSGFDAQLHVVLQGVSQASWGGTEDETQVLTTLIANGQLTT